MNLAERLGYSPDDRVLIIHADDVGMSHAANEAALEAMESGSITCGSVLVPCPWFPEVAERCRSRPNADMGVHMTLTCEYPRYRWRPLTGRGAAPTLYDEQGYMWATTAEAVANVSPEDGARELRAQIETALAAGVDITHLDTHMGTVMFPKFIEAYISLGIEYRVPVFLVRPSRELLESRGMLSYLETLEGQVKRVDEASLPVLDAIEIDTLGKAPEDKEAYFKDIFANLQPGVTHFLIHPAKPSDELSAITEDAAHRARDYELFRGSSMRKHIEGLGIHLIGYREIREAFRSGALKN